MSALICDICGGKLAVGSGGIAKCDSCDTEHTKERVQEKVQEIKGTVKIEGAVQTSSTEQQLETAQRHMQRGNYVEAQKIYDALAIDYSPQLKDGIAEFILLKDYKYYRDKDELERPYSRDNFREFYNEALHIASSTLHQKIVQEDEMYWDKLIKKFSNPPESFNIFSSDYGIFSMLPYGSERAIAFYNESRSLAMRIKKLIGINIQKHPQNERLWITGKINNAAIKMLGGEHAKGADIFAINENFIGTRTDGDSDSGAQYLFFYKVSNGVQKVKQMEEWKSQGRCPCCGGRYSIFSERCTHCRSPKIKI